MGETCDVGEGKKTLTRDNEIVHLPKFVVIVYTSCGHKDKFVASVELFKN